MDYRYIIVFVGCLVCVTMGCSKTEPPAVHDKAQSKQTPAEDSDKRVGPRRPADSPPIEELQPPPEILAKLEKKRPTDDPTLANSSERLPTIEKISGYKTPAEYFTLNSKNYDGAVGVTLPIGYSSNSGQKYPLLIVFGGAGECARPPRQGALAWMGYYKMDEAVAALKRGRLSHSDFRGLANKNELRRFNRNLSENPYKGMIIACPSSPPVYGAAGPEFPSYEEYIMYELIPALIKHYPVLEDRIGVDGVSMGGARSMYYGLKYPEVFTSIGAVQGAFGPYSDLYRFLIKRGADDLKNRSIQITTSGKDVMLHSNEKMSKLLARFKIPHSFLVLTGPHDYIFNQGPGSISLLMFHNQALHAPPQIK